MARAPTIIAVSVLALVVSCATGPEPVADELLLPLPAGYTVVEDSVGGAFDCGTATCNRRWTVRASVADDLAVDHAATLATHVGANVGRTLELVDHPDIDPRHIYASSSLWIKVQLLPSGLIEVAVVQD